MQGVSGGKCHPKETAAGMGDPAESGRGALGWLPSCPREAVKWAVITSRDGHCRRPGGDAWVAPRVGVVTGSRLCSGGGAAVSM